MIGLAVAGRLEVPEGTTYHPKYIDAALPVVRVDSETGVGASGDKMR